MQAAIALDPRRKAALGQYFSSPAVESEMTRMLHAPWSDVRLLDAGAGTGLLTAASVAELCSRPACPRSIDVTAYEIDQVLLPHLHNTLELCAAFCAKRQVSFSWRVLNLDFIEDVVPTLAYPMLSTARSYNCAIMNPPYSKISSRSPYTRLLSAINSATPNTYTAFMELATRSLETDGELVAIVPRSFTNGTYFRDFRRRFLHRVNLRHLHIYDSRSSAFGEDSVLQENIIVAATRSASEPSVVVLSRSAAPGDDSIFREVDSEVVVAPQDDNYFIRLTVDRLAQQVTDTIERLPCRLSDLGVSASTGRVGDFRAEPWLLREPPPDTAPLLYPGHFSGGRIAWPRPGSRKPNAIAVVPETRALLMPQGHYVPLKRFSAKEERRRLVAALLDPRDLPIGPVAIENHVNVLHVIGAGLEPELASGLCAYLTSSVVDDYFRQFSGHTQVNATDLRSLPYPTTSQLLAIESSMHCGHGDQATIDRAVSGVIEFMPDYPSSALARKRIDEALAFLQDLGMPRAQLNDRSALTLLSLLNIQPQTQWTDASDPLIGIAPMRKWIHEYYDKQYAPNSRETVRRQTIHQFRQAGMVIQNPDDPLRATNSGKTVYRVTPEFLRLAQEYGTGGWRELLAEYLSVAGTLAERYASARSANRVPVQLPDGIDITLAAGGQTGLIHSVITEFCPVFLPGARVVYIGDAGDKFLVFDRIALSEIAIEVELHGKMPDVVVIDERRNWLVLIEAVTSHGPVGPKRRAELEELFGSSSADLIFVSAFEDRRAMSRHMADIAWETEVWIAEAPTHLVHFGGDRFLGPDE